MPTATQAGTPVVEDDGERGNGYDGDEHELLHGALLIRCLLGPSSQDDCLGAIEAAYGRLAVS